MIKLSARDIVSSSSFPVRINKSIILCEYMRSEKERETGLMHRTFMPSNCGAIFDTYGRYRPVFHMKNVYLPLEAIFISNQNKIVDIVPMKPLDVSTIYTTYKNVPIKHVIEVNRYYCDRHGVKINDLVFFD